MKAYCRDLGRMDYKTCWDLQQELFDAGVARKRTGPIPVPVPGADDADDAGTVLLVEHPPVYTLGKSGHAENLLVNQEALKAMGAQFFHIDRGGDITFHGPGQLVCYPILDLERLGIGLRDYIGALEEAVIRTVAAYGITAGRMAGASGVWIGPGIGGETGSRTTGCRGDNGGNCNIGGNCGNKSDGNKSDGGKSGDSKSGDSGENRNEAGTCDSGRACDSEIGVGNRTSARVPRKICAIGVRSSRYITMHGFALNVTTDLGWFTRINPCGFTDRGVTSIERETGRKAAMGEVKELVVKFLSEILNVRIYK